MALTYENEKKGWFSTLLKIAFFTGAFLLVMFTVLANMGGSSEALKDGVEKFLSDASGRPVTVGTLNRMTFYPYIAVDVEDVRMNNAEGDPQAVAEKAQIAMSFWDVVFRTGKLKSLKIENLRTLPGLLGGRPLHVESLGIFETTKDEKAWLKSEGTYGSERFSFKADMEVLATPSRRKYRFPAVRPFEVTLGGLSFSGTMEDARAGLLKMTDIRIAVPDEALTGMLEFSTDTDQNLYICGALRTPQMAVTPDLTLAPEEKGRALSGDIVMDVFHPAELKQGGALYGLCEKLNELLKGSSFRAAPPPLEVTVKAGQVFMEERNRGPLAVALRTENGALAVENKAAGDEGVIEKLAQDPDFSSGHPCLTLMGFTAGETPEDAP